MEIGVEVKNHSKRTSAIVRAREGGATLEVIGKRHGITRERVRQILISAGVPPVGAGTYARKKCEPRLNEAIRRYMVTPEWITLRRASEGLVSEQTLRRALIERGISLRPRPEPPHGGSGYRYGHLGCRCDECRAANRAKQARFNAMHRAKGLCWHCNAKAAKGRSMCAYHLAAMRVASRAKTQAAEGVTNA